MGTRLYHIQRNLDFFDGMLARVLKAPSLIGKELDSLADDISFGLVRSHVVFTT
jgi:CDP-diacylglycerol--serine O-phosphatidyltransferase